ncbi:hypothetical protein TNCV_1982861 [Trichonephila clavipes]|nr:hypothetical protein TNCV_1982861 [Trichonephila clavipes]
MTRRRLENREGSLRYPGFVRPVFTKDIKPLGLKEKITKVPRDCDTRTHLKKREIAQLTPSENSRFSQIRSVEVDLRLLINKSRKNIKIILITNR